MTDYKIPELPSDDELGITDEDRKEYAREAKPEPIDKELAALLGDRPRAPSAPVTPIPSKPKESKADSERARSSASQASDGGPARGGRVRGAATLVALVALSWTASSASLLPSPRAANAPDTVFSSARAMATLVEIAQRPRPTGSPEHDRVRALLVERLEQLGLSPEVQTATSMIGRDSLVDAATVRNIVARVPGTASTGAVLLTAHYDGRRNSPAAGDDGVGVVTILETLRALERLPPLQNDLVVLLTDGEEIGLLGARAFVRDHPLMDDVAVVISLEMRGGGGAVVMFEAGREDGWIVRELAASGARPFANSVSDAVYRSLPTDTDFTPFRDAGLQGLNFAAVGRGSVYHESNDVPARVSEATLQHHGDNALRIVRRLGAADLATVDAPDVTYFSAPILGLVAYGTGLVWPLSGATLLLAVASLGLVFVRTRKAGILAGFTLAVVAIALSWGVGYGLARWLPKFHAESGALIGSQFHREGPYIVALASFALAIVCALFGLARRRLPAAAVVWGALLVPLTATAYLSLRLPVAAHTLQWPAMAAFLGVALLLVPWSPLFGALAWAGRIALAAPVLVLLLPLTEVLAQVLGFSAAPQLAVLMASTGLLLLPALDGLLEPNRWWAPLSASLVGAAALALGILTARPSANRPAPSTLLFAYDHGTEEALWVGDPNQDSLDVAAMAWARSKAGGTFEERRSLEHFSYPAGEVPVAPARPPVIPKPEMTVLVDSVVGGTRHLRLALRSSVGAEQVQLRFPPTGRTRLIALNGMPLPAGASSGLVNHWGRPDSAIVLDLEVLADDAVQMDVVEHLLRPEELLGAQRFERPAELAPNIRTMSDRAMLRAPFTVLDLRAPSAPPAEGPPEVASIPPS